MLDQWTYWEAGKSWSHTGLLLVSESTGASVVQMQELEQRVAEADQRAVNAEKQVRETHLPTQIRPEHNHFPGTSKENGASSSFHV